MKKKNRYGSNPITVTRTSRLVQSHNFNHHPLIIGQANPPPFKGVTQGTPHQQPVLYW